MTDRYYNPGQPCSFGGLPIAERYLKGNVNDFLIWQDAYTLHRPIRHCFRRRHTFLKYAWVRSLKNKSGLRVKEAFESRLREKVSLYLQSDKDTEFNNTLFQGQLAEYVIKFYTSENDDIKAAIV